MLPKTQVFITYYLNAGKKLSTYLRTGADCLAETNDFFARRLSLKYCCWVEYVDYVD